MSFERLSSGISNFEFNLVDSEMMGYGYTQTQESEEYIRQNSFSFPAKDLIELSESELFDLSKEIRIAFTKVASRSMMKIDRQGLNQLKPGRDNILVHETAHFKVIKKLRPELVENSFVHVLAVTHEGRVLVATSIESPKPEISYTAEEKAQIQLAPHYPSDQDYFGLFDYIKSMSINIEEISQIKNIARTKPRCEGKDHIIRLLEMFDK